MTVSSVLFLVVVEMILDLWGMFQSTCVWPLEMGFPWRSRRAEQVRSYQSVGDMWVGVEEEPGLMGLYQLLSRAVPPEFVIPLSEVTCETGETVVLRCRVCGRPKASITWKGPEHNTLNNDGHYSISYR